MPVWFGESGFFRGLNVAAPEDGRTPRLVRDPIKATGMISGRRIVEISQPTGAREIGEGLPIGKIAGCLDDVI